MNVDSQYSNFTTIAALAAALSVGSAALAQTQGPGGESPTPTSEITLSDEEVAKVKDGNHTAALLWHTSSDFVNAVTAGATDEFERLGIEVVATTDAASTPPSRRATSKR